MTGKRLKPAGFCARWRCAIIVFSFGIAFLVMAASMKIIVDKIFHAELISNLEIKQDNSNAYKQWKSPSIPIHTEFYVFDIVNAMEMKQGKSPVVEQKGPYTYREILDKRNISFDQEKPAASYNQKTTYLFDKELSCKDCDPYRDDITTVNMPFVILSEVARNYSGVVKFLFEIFFRSENEDLLMTKSVQELLWGYNDTMFAAFSGWKKKYPFLNFIPDISPFMTLQPNDTYEGESTVNTGVQDINLVGVLEMWNGRKDVGLWKTVYANMFNGSDGSRFRPGVTKADTLYFFSTNLCRSLYINFDTKNDIKGIKVYRFTTPADIFKNSTHNPDNAAFCLHRCYPYGILPGTKDCKPSTMESPIVVSTPHFLIGDPYLRTQVEGLSPNKEKHGLFISIEPMMGIPLQALIRLQLNLHIQSIPGISQTNGIKEAYIPVMYFNNNITVDDATAKMLRDQIILPLSICFYVEIALYVLGGLFVVVAVMMFFKKRMGSSSHELINVNSNGAESEQPIHSESDAEREALIPKPL